MFNSTLNDRGIRRLLRTLDNITVPSDLTERCIAASQKNGLVSDDVSPFSFDIAKGSGNRQEEETASKIFTNLSDRLLEIRRHHPLDEKEALKEFLHEVKRASNADVMTCYLSQGPNSPTRDELTFLSEKGTWLPHKMGGLVKRRNIQLLLLDKEPQVFENACADYIFSDSDFLRRENVKSVISLPFKGNSQKGIAFLSYRKGSEVQPEIGKLLINNVPRWLSSLLGDQRNSPQIGSGGSQGMQNRDFAELIKKTAAEGLTDERIGEIFKTLSSWLKLRNTFFSWHEINEEERKIRLRYLHYDDEMGTSISYDKVECILDDNQGVVAEAAQSGTYVLVDDIYRKEWLRKYKNLPIRGTYPEIRSELAVPLNRYDGVQVGVLNLESPKKGRFNDDHACQIEKIGQAIIIAAQTHEMMAPQNQDLTKSIYTLFDSFIPIEQMTDIGTPKKVKIITDLAVNIFDACAVDIWQYDHKNQEFSKEWGLSTSDMFGQKCYAKEFSAEHLREKFQPRKYGNSRQLMENPNTIKRIKDAADPSQKHGVSPDTIALGIRSLLGIPIVGPQSTYPDGVMWLRFDEVVDFNHDLIETAQKLAGFMHMLWNPLFCNLPSPERDDFEVGDHVIMIAPYIDPDELIVEGEKGVILKKHAKVQSLYLVNLVNAKRRVWLERESLEHLKARATSPVCL